MIGPAPIIALTATATQKVREDIKKILCMANAKEFVHRFVLTDIENKKLFFDSKTILQEMIQGISKGALSYRLTKEEGPDHDKKFTVEAVLDGNVLSVGVGRTKKGAEQEAAYHAILYMNEKSKNKEQV